MMRRRFRSLPIGEKLRLVLMLVAASALLVYASLTLIHGLREVEQFNRENLQALLDVTARNLEAPLVFNDGRAAQDTLRALSADPAVIEVLVSDAQGQLFARYLRGNPLQQERLAWLPASWNRIRESREIVFRSGVVGHIELLASRDGYWDAVGRGALIWLLVTVLSMLAAVLAARRLQHIIAAPVVRLEQATRDITRHKRFSLRVEREESGSEDEVGRLIDSFNAMLAEIEQRDERLARYRESLEEMVASRTEELTHSRDAAEEASRVKSRFLATMSHEIRTPLNGVLGMIRLLQTTALSGDQRRMTEAALRSGETLLNVLNDVLDFSKIEAGKLTVDAVPFDLADTVESAALLLAPNAREKGLELAVHLKGELPVTLAGDPNRLKQVLFNLLGNAVKFTEQGEVCLRVERSPGAAGDSRERGDVILLRFTVRDTGPGIPESEQGKLFQAYSQTNAASQTPAEIEEAASRRAEGTGLGLAISRELVRLMGASDLTVSSRPGEGCEFSFELPFHVVRDNPTGIHYPGFRLLLLEPQPTLALILQDYAQSLGLDCRLARNAAEAERLLGEGAAQAVLADLCYLQLPEATWQDWHRRCGGVWIALSDFGASTLEGELAQVFAQRLSKPVSRKEFVRSIGQAFMVAPRGAELPPAAGWQGAAWRPAAAAVPNRPRFHGKVLLVEDNLTNQEVTRGLLQVFGCQVEVANHGREALEKWAERDFDLILMDCQMPVMDGLTASRELRQREIQAGRLPTAIIALTANSFAEDRQRCLAAGMNGFLPKPFDELALVALLTDWLGPPEGGAQVRVQARPEREAGALLDAAVLDAIAARQEEAGEVRSIFLARFVSTFLAQASQALQNMAQDDLAAAREAAHSLKSAAASIGARPLSELAARVEAAAREGQAAEVRRLGESLPQLLADTRSALERYMEQGGH